jgi:DNA-binding NarL/FixJ family response regulator
MTDKARILIVDDHPLVREWLGHLIERSPDLAVCGEAEDSEQALKLIAETKPHLAIIDLSLGAVSGLDLIRQIRATFPDLAMIVLSMHDEQVYAERCIRAGARGYIMKRESTRTVVDAIHEVLKGNLYLSKKVTMHIVEKVVSSDMPNSGPPVGQLSDRELEVFKLLGQGYEINEIAKMLEVNIKTVHTYCARMKEKMKVGTTAELLREALRWNGTLSHS